MFAAAGSEGHSYVTVGGSSTRRLDARVSAYGNSSPWKAAPLAVTGNPAIPLAFGSGIRFGVGDGGAVLSQPTDHSPARYATPNGATGLQFRTTAWTGTGMLPLPIETPLAHSSVNMEDTTAALPAPTLFLGAPFSTTLISHGDRIAIQNLPSITQQ